MKKIIKLLFCLLCLFTVASCGGKSEAVNLKIIMPSGAPSIAQAGIEYNGSSINEDLTYSVERVSDTTLLAAAFSSGEYDIIYAPTNLGAKFYNNNQNYVYAATITFGNLYFASTNKTDFTISSLSNQTVYLFGEGTINDAVVTKVLTDNNVTNVNKVYLSGTDYTKNQLVTDHSSIVMIAEPVLSAATVALKTAGETVQTIDIESLIGTSLGGSGFAQAGVFVKKEVASKNKTEIKTYLKKLSASCDLANSDPTLVAGYATELNYGLPGTAVLAKAIPNCNIKYVSAKNSKDIFEATMNLNLTLIGGKLPDEEFYAF